MPSCPKAGERRPEQAQSSSVRMEREAGFRSWEEERVRPPPTFLASMSGRKVLPQDLESGRKRRSRFEGENGDFCCEHTDCGGSVMHLTFDVPLKLRG